MFDRRTTFGVSKENTVAALGPSTDGPSPAPPSAGGDVPELEPELEVEPELEPEPPSPGG
jgi:hypothetical protein